MKDKIESLIRKAIKHEVERESDRIFRVRCGNKSYIVVFNKNKLLCDCMHSSLHPEKLCSHKLAVLNFIEDKNEVEEA